MDELDSLHALRQGMPGCYVNGHRVDASKLFTDTAQLIALLQANGQHLQIAFFFDGKLFT